MDIVMRNAYHYRDIVVGTYLGEGPCRISGGLYDEYLVRFLREAGAYGVGLSLLE